MLNLLIYCQASGWRYKATVLYYLIYINKITILIY